VDLDAIEGVFRGKPIWNIPTGNYAGNIRQEFVGDLQWDYFSVDLG
jgi:hypothetical protein